MVVHLQYIYSLAISLVLRFHHINCSVSDFFGLLILPPYELLLLKRYLWFLSSILDPCFCSLFLSSSFVILSVCELPAPQSCLFISILSVRQSVNCQHLSLASLSVFSVSPSVCKIWNCEIVSLCLATCYILLISASSLSFCQLASLPVCHALFLTVELQLVSGVQYIVYWAADTNC
jgi:hypothetical protein